MFTSRLTALPLEIKERILTEILPRDIPSFSSSCREFHYLAAERLKEHKYLTNATHGGQDVVDIDVSNLRQIWQDHYVTTLQLLVSLEGNPRLAWYIRNLKQSSSGIRGPLTDSEGKDDSQATLAKLKRLIYSSTFSTEDDHEDWIEAIQSGEGGALLALLFTQLPHLESFQLIDRPSDPINPYLGRIIGKIVAKQQSLSHRLISLNNAHVWCLGEEHQQQEYDSDGEEIDLPDPVLHPQDHHEQLIHLFIALVALPHFEHISLMDFGDVESFNVGPVLPSYSGMVKSSQLKSITLQRSNISVHDLSPLLRHSYKFMNFTYSIDQGCRYGTVHEADLSSSYALFHICQVLLAYAQSTLHTLYFELCDYGGRCGCRQNPCVRCLVCKNGLQQDAEYHRCGMCPPAPPTVQWNLQKFSALKRLTLDIDVFSTKGGGWQSFMQILPISIEDVSIICYYLPYTGSTADTTSMLSGFRPQEFPDLRSICFFHGKNWYERPKSGASVICSTIKCALEIAGVLFEEYTLVNDLDADKLPQRHRWSMIGQLRDMGSLSMMDEGIHRFPECFSEGKVIMGVNFPCSPNTDNSETAFEGVRFSNSRT